MREGSKQGMRFMQLSRINQYRRDSAWQGDETRLTCIGVDVRRQWCAQVLMCIGGVRIGAVRVRSKEDEHRSNS